MLFINPASKNFLTICKWSNSYYMPISKWSIKYSATTYKWSGELVPGCPRFAPAFGASPGNEANICLTFSVVGCCRPLHSSSTPAHSTMQSARGGRKKKARGFSRG